MTSAKYPGWTIEKTTFGGRTSYTMTRVAGIYSIEVNKDSAGEWFGELMTLRGWNDTTRKTWHLARNAFSGSVGAVVDEAERRAGWIEKPAPTDDESWAAHLDAVARV